jgi:uncharacterized protein
MPEHRIAPRLRRQPLVTALGLEVPAAVGFRLRLLGLTRLEREEAGVGLLIPRCSSVHTFGMHFALDVFFLDRRGAAIEVRRGIGPRRVVLCCGADAVLELPSGERRRN